MSAVVMPDHVLITRLSAIGDCVVTLPVAAAIKRASPDTRVTWAVSCAAHQLLDICPDVDHVLKVSKRWMRERGEWQKLRQYFRQHPADCVIDPQSLVKSSLLGWLSGAKQRVGFARPLGRELSPWMNTISIDGRNAHLGDAQLRLLEPIGIEKSDAEFHLVIPREVQRWSGNIVERLAGHSAPIVMNPGAGWGSRLWPATRYGEVAVRAKADFGLPSVVVWSGDSEREMAADIVAGSEGAAVMAPETSLVQLAAVVARARIFLSSDTGPMHIAAAMGTQCLSLHGPTAPELSGPYGAQHRSIRKIAFDGLLRRGEDNSAMMAIEVNDVYEQLAEMLADAKGVETAA